MSASSTTLRPLALKFRLDDVPAEGRAFEGELSRAQLESDLPGMVGKLGYRPSGPAPIHGTVYRSAKHELVVSGGLRAEVGFDCVRCLGARALHVDIREDHVLVQRKAPVEVDGETVVDADALDEPDTESFIGDDVDLTDLFRQDLLLALPMNPSCADVDRGNACEELVVESPSEEDEIDPRWAPLLELKKKMT